MHRERGQGRRAARLFGAAAAMLLCALLIAPQAFGQADTFMLGDGHDGAYNPGGNATLNSAAPVSGALAAGASTITIGAVRGGTAGFAAGRLVMVLQATGYTGTVTSGDQTPIDLTNGSVGRWEFARISSFAGSTVNLTAPLINSYASAATQIVAVPEFTTVTIASGRTIQALDWDGTSGGVTAFLATGAVSHSGTLSAAGRGMRGGPTGSNSGNNCSEMDGNTQNARKGEGIYPAGFGSTQVARGNKTNGGGGGNCADAGGAGGGHGGIGGKGSFDGVGVDHNAFGGTRLVYSPYTRINFGGGAGSGFRQNVLGSGTPGGAGGGIVLVRGASMSGAGLVTAVGASASDAGLDGAGGGGAGGAVYMRFTGSATCDVDAYGGNGGSAAEFNGPGGGGAGGVVVVQGSPLSCSAEVQAGSPGLRGLVGNGGAGPESPTDPANIGSTTQNPTPLSAPTSAITAPAAGSSTNNARPPISGTATANSSIEVYIDGVLNGVTTANGSGAWTYTPPAALANSAHTVYVIPTSLGITGGQSTSVSFTVDTIPPAAPSITTPPGSLITNNQTPTIAGTAEANATVTVYDGATPIGTTTANGSGSWSFTPGSALAEGTHSITARATDPAGNQGVASTARSVTIDRTTPTVIISTPTAGQWVNDNTPDITFAVTEANPGDTACSVDGATALGGCTSPFTTGTLTEGSHTVLVRHTDAAGNIGSASRTFNVDTTNPVVAISAPTAGQIVNTTTPSVVFSVTEANPGSTQCAIDAGTFASCSSPYTPSALTQGAHTVNVRHTDLAGNTVTASRSFTVDTIAPAAPVITVPPGNITVSFLSGTIDGTAEPGSTVTLLSSGSPIGTATADGAGNWKISPSGLTANGTYTVTARATDVASNTGPESAPRVITIDSVNPVVTITSPASGAFVPSTTPAITFGITDANPGSSACSVDGGAFVPCNSPYTTPALTNGGHTVDVRHVDLAGNIGSASRSFTVDTVTPVVTISAPTAGAVLADNTPDVSFAVSEANPGTTECQVDAGAFAPCTSPFTTPTLTDGPHSVTIRHTDLAGNAGTAVRNFNIDTAAPAAPVITTPAGDVSTNNQRPPISGTAEPNSTVTVFDGATPLGTTTASGGGAWNFTLTSDLAVGAHVITARATDAAGNQGAASAPRTITIDLTAPAAPVITVPAGSLVTNNPTPAISGTAEPNSTVTVFDGATPLGTATANGAGAWSFTPSSALNQTVHQITARATDAAGNQSAASAPRAITIDLGPPNVTITSPTSGQLVNDTTPDVSFTLTEANPGTSECAVDGGSFTACNSPFTTPVLGQGVRTVTVRHTDAAGNVGSAIVSFTVDSIAPAAPVITVPPGDVVTSSANGSLVGTAEPNAVITILAAGVPSGTTTANASGNWDFASPITAPDGVYVMSVTATDAAGNVSAPSATRTITVDTISPVVAISSPTNGQFVGTISPNVVFSVTELNAGVTECAVDGAATFTVCSSPFATSGLAQGAHSVTVRHSDLAGNVGSSVVNFTVDTVSPVVTIGAPPAGAVLADNTPDVVFSVSGASPNSSECQIDAGAFAPCGSPFTTPALTDGPHSVTVRHIDQAGNSGTATRSFSIDTGVPAAPVITTPAGNITTSDTTPTLSGTAEGGATVTIFDGATPAGTVVADGGGAWTFTPSTGLGEGPHVFTARATDAAGNQSAASTPRTITIDTIAPAAPVITTPAGNITTSNQRPTISGSSEPGALITIYDDGAQIGTTTADGGGAWSFTPGSNLNQSVHTITARATDTSGNQGPASAPRAITIDTGAPLVTITAPSSGQFINDATPDVVFTVVETNPGVTECQIDGGAFTACSSPFTTPTLSEGTHTVTVRHTDAAGNAGTAARSFTVDTIAPAPPIVTFPAEGHVSSNPTGFVRGTSEPLVHLIGYIDGVEAGSADADATGNWSGAAVTPPSDGPLTFTAVAIDAAGNVSAPSLPLHFTIDTTAPAVAISAPTAGQFVGTASPTASFSVTDANPGTTECSTTSVVSFAGCSSPFTMGPLSNGEHTLLIRHTDLGGNTGSASVTFTVDTIAPVVTISAPAEGALLSDNTPDVSFAVSEAHAGTTDCQIDSGTFVACSSPFTTVALADGPHSVTVRHTDLAGNIGSAVRSFSIDTAAPAAPVITTPAGNISTNNQRPSISGTAEPNSTVTIFDGATPLGTTTASGTGTWSFTPASNLTAGPHVITARATDSVGNQGAASASRTITIDLTAPAAPVITVPPGDIFTSDRRPPLAGTAEPGAIVTIYSDGVPVVTTTADGTGAWAFNRTVDANFGAFTINAQATDAAGNQSPLSAPRLITIDFVPPSVTISSPTGGQLLTDTTPDVVFSVVESNPGATECQVDGGAFAPCSSPFTTPALADGPHSATVQHTDLAGNVGSATVSFTIDATAPAPPVITGPPVDIYTSVPNGVLSGVAEPGALITIYADGAGGGVISGTTTADGSGNWQFSSPVGLVDGAHLLSATATDAAGNVSARSATRTITIDTVTPVVSISSPVNGQFISNTNPDIVFSVSDTNLGTTECQVDSGAFAPCSSPFATPTLSQAAHTVTVRHTDLAGNVGSAATTFTVDTIPPVVTISAPPTGAVLADNTPDVVFSISGVNPNLNECQVDGGAFAACSSPFTTPVLADGPHSVTVRHTDRAGNVGSASRSFSIDTAAPAAPLITSPPGDISTSDLTPTLIGSAEAGSTITIYDGGTPVGSATADGSGAWSFTPASNLSEGAHVFTATATDAGGNQSAPSASRTITLDASAPAAPAITSPAGNITTSNQRPPISGSSESGALISIFDGAASIGTTTADGTGAWSFTPATNLNQAVHTITARATDAAGNQSAASAPRAITIDTTSPAVSISAPPSGQFTNDATPDVVFSIVETNPGITECQVDAGAFTACSSPFTTPSLSEGPHTVTVRHTDAAGNAGTAARSFTVDTIAPAPPITTFPPQNYVSSNPTGFVTGTAEPFAHLVGFIDGAPAGTADADAAGNWTGASITAPGDGPLTFTAIAVDAAGNQSAPSIPLTFIIDTTAPAVTISAPTDGQFVGTASPAVTFSIADANPGSSECEIDGGGFTACSSPALIAPLADGTHTLTIRHTDLGDNTGSASVSFTVDTITPVVTISAPAAGAVLADNTPDVSFSVSEAHAATTECQIDSGVFVSCSSPFTTVALADGPHSVTVRHTDLAGNIGSAVRSFSIDTSAPAAPAITTPAGDITTNNQRPAIAGTAEANSTVTIFDGATPLGTTTANGSGSWNFTLTSDLAAGAHPITARATDSAGNQSAASATRTITIDLTAPAAPVITVPAGNVVTSDRTPTISGTAEAGATITVFDGATPIGTTTADGGGAWSFTPSTNLASGPRTVTARATDPAGNSSPLSASRVITIDFANPAVSIGSPTAGQIVNDATPDIVFGVTDANPGTSECAVDGGGFVPCTSPFTTASLSEGPHSVTVRHTDLAGNIGTTVRSFSVDTVAGVVEITSPAEGASLSDTTPTIEFTISDVGGTSECEVDGGGFVPCTSPFTTGTLGEGGHAVTVRYTDSASNVTTAVVNFIVDVTAPGAPAITAPPSGTVTNDPSEVVSGTAEAGSTVTLFAGSTAIGSSTADGGGNWTITPVPALPEGANVITATATDAAGNVSAQSSSITIVVDTIDPLITIDSPAPGAFFATTTPTIEFTITEANPGITECAVDGGAFGTCSSPFTTAPLADGSHTVDLRHADAAGDTGSASVSLTVDTIAPVVTISTPAAGAILADNTPEISFAVSEANSGTTQCQVDAGLIVACSSPVTTAALAEGPHSITVSHTDLAGNVGSAVRSFSIDTAAPAAPLITTPAGDVSTNNPRPPIAGTAEPNSTVTAFDGATPLGTTAASGSGAWNFTLTSDLAAGAHPITARATDSAGNQSAASLTRTITIDLTAPAAPVITVPAGNIVTSNQRPTISGTDEAGATITLFDGATPIGTTTADGGGAWSFTPASNLNQAAHTITARSTDAAGNQSPLSAARVITIDFAPPSVTISSPTNGQLLTDTTPDIVFSVVESNPGVTECQIDTGAFAACSSPFTTVALADGPHSVTVRHTDLAGNVGSAVASFTIDATAPAPPVITGPPVDIYTSVAGGTLSGTAEPGALITIYADGAGGGVISGTTTADGSGNWQFASPDNLVDGAHLLSATATDAAGNVSARSATRTITIDTVTPVVSISSPTSGQFISNTSPDVVFSVSDTNPGTTECQVDGGAYAPCSSPLTTPTLAQGLHTVTVRHTDLAGNVGSASVSFTVDTILPVVTISAPPAGAVLADNTPDVVFSIAGVNQNLTECQVDGGAFAPCSSPFTTPTLSEGPHSVTVRHTDRAGNVGSATRSFSIDTAAPAAPLITSPAGDITTTNLRPTLIGSAEAGATITIYDGGSPVGTTTADGAGAWSFTPPANLSEVAHVFTATATDAGGSQSAPSESRTITIDASAPTAPLITDPAGSLTTSDQTPTISGTSEAAAMITIYDGAAPIGTTTADGTGAWSFTPATNLNQAVHTITARASDAAGNQSALSVPRAITIDTIAPAVAISAPPAGQVVGDATPDIVFTVVETNPGTSECQVDGGAFAPCSSPFTTPALSEGPHTVTVRHTDAAGNVGTAARSFTVDTVAPAAPVITNPAGNLFVTSWSGTIDGTAELGSTVTLLSSGSPIGSASTDGAGNWKIAPAGITADGVYTLTARATDVAGNTSPESAPRVITVDTINPVIAIGSPAGGATLATPTPTVTFSVTEANPGTTSCAIDGGAYGPCSSPFTTPSLADGPHTVDVRHVDLAGHFGVAAVSFTVDTLPPVVTINAPVAGAVLSDATPDISFSIGDANPGTTECQVDATAFVSCSSPFTTVALTEGPHSVTVRHTDLAGNAGSATRNFSIDTGAPLAPVITTPATDITTNDQRPAIAGTAEPNSTVTVFDGATPLGTTTTSGAGAWNFTLTSDLAAGAHPITAHATDSAGNESPASAARTITIDLTAPAAPVITVPPGDLTTNNPRPTVSGTAEAGATVTIFDGSTPIGVTTADGTGAWTMSPVNALNQAAHPVTARATDAAGNQSAPSATRTITIDTTPPVVTISSPTAGQLINDTTPDISFALVEINPGASECRVDGGGFLPCSSPFTTSTLTEGAHSVTVRHTDAAGNVGSAAVSFTVDSIAPAPPVITQPPGDVVTSLANGSLVGTAEPNAVITILAAGVPSGTTTADAAGNWEFASPITAPDAVYVMSVTATDAAGNVSAPSATRTITVDTVSPLVAISSPANGQFVASTAPDVVFSVTELNAGVTDCSVDGAAFTVCASPLSTTALAQGAHSVTVRHTDLAGNVGSSVVNFTVDTVVPVVTIGAPPAGAVLADNTPDVVFSVSGASPNPSECQIDAGAFAPCSSPFTTAALTDGPHSVTVRHIDQAGNSGTATRSFSVDTGVPAAPLIMDPATDITTSDRTPTLSGTAEPNATITILDGGAPTGTATADGGGAWSFTPSTNLSDGAHVFTARAADAAGNQSAASAPRTITIDTTAPAAPTITAPATDTATSNQRPTISGTAEPGALITIYDDGAQIGTTTADSGGAWSFTPSSNLNQSAHPITARATDSSGNQGPASALRVITIDTTAPLVTITAPPSGQFTNDATPDIVFSVVETNPGTTECQVDSGAFAPCSSPFTTPALSEGPHTVTVRHTDAAGNAGTAARSFTVDTIPPAAPLVTFPTDGYVSSNPTGFVRGTAEPFAHLIGYIDGVESGTADADAAGNWQGSATVPPGDGTLTFTTVAIDAAGNQSPLSVPVTFTIDTTDPAISITAPTAGQFVATNSPSANFAVTDANPGSTECSIDSVDAFTPCSSPFAIGPLAEGAHTLTVRHTDLGGNTGSAGVNFTVDTVAPVVTISSPAAGAVLADDTPDVGFEISEANLGSTECQVDSGAFATCSSPFTTGALADGSHSVTVRHNDLAGNVGTSSVNFTIDTGLPSAPAITTPTADIVTNDQRPGIAGTAEPNSTVTVYDAGSPIGTANADGGGAWSFVPAADLAEGAHAITATATDAGGNQGPASTTRTITIDITAPAAPLITSPPGDIITNNRRPTTSGTAEPNSTVTFYADGAAVQSATADGTGAWSFTAPFDLPAGPHVVFARATDAAGNQSAASASIVITIDFTAPTVTISAPTAGQSTNDATPDVVFSVADDNLGSSECQVDGGGFGMCSSPFTAAPLSEGSHTATVRHTDLAGNVGTASVNFTVDLTAPSTTLTANPPVNDATRDPSFSFTSDDPAATFECQLDGGGFSPCASPLTYSGLADGAHTFDVRAVDAAGNADTTPATFAWTIDTVPPAEPILLTPLDGAVTGDPTPALTGTAESGSTVQIYADSVLLGTAVADGSGNWSFAVTNPLADGSHVFDASATDAAGNVSGQSNVARVTVDTGPPQTTIDSAPPLLGNSPDATFEFSSSEAGSTFECQLDGGGFTPCTSPNSFTGLAAGQHTFAVRATDAAGNPDPTPAIATWRIDDAMPAAPAIDQPADDELLNINTPTFSGTAEPNATVTVTVNGVEIGTTTADATGAWTLAAPPALPDGAHQARARATDRSGNTGPDSPVSAFTIDTVAPDGNVLAEAESGGDGVPPTFIIETPDPTATITCSVDGEPFAPCSSPYTPATTAAGSHRLTVRFTDPAGNVSVVITDFEVVSSGTQPPVTPPNMCPDGSAPVPAAVVVKRATINRKTLLRFHVDSQKFTITRVTIKRNGKKQSEVRAVHPGGRLIVLKIPKLWRYKKLPTTLNIVTSDGGKQVAETTVRITSGGRKATVSSLYGSTGLACAVQSAAKPFDFESSVADPGRAGGTRLTVSASSSEYSAATFKVIQKGVDLTRKVFVVDRGQRRTMTLKLLPGKRLAAGPATLAVSVFSADGARTQQTRTFNVP